jgi:hypothetical protein
LRAVATSAAYGAPQQRVRVKKHVAVKAQHATAKSKQPRPKPKQPPLLSRSAFGASVDTVGSAQSVIVWLAVALLVIAAFGAGAAVSRWRRDGR